MYGKNQKYDETYLKYAHNACSIHRTEIETSTLCGCFYCLKTFSPAEILEWIEEPFGDETAICPYCGIDSVLSLKYPITDAIFLQEMNQYWF